MKFLKYGFSKNRAIAETKKLGDELLADHENVNFVCYDTTTDDSSIHYTSGTVSVGMNMLSEQKPLGHIEPITFIHSITSLHHEFRHAEQSTEIDQRTDDPQTIRLAKAQYINHNFPEFYRASYNNSAIENDADAAAAGRTLDYFHKNFPQFKDADLYITAYYNAIRSDAMGREATSVSDVQAAFQEQAEQKHPAISFQDIINHEQEYRSQMSGISFHDSMFFRNLKEHPEHQELFDKMPDMESQTDLVLALQQKYQPVVDMSYHAALRGHMPTLKDLGISHNESVEETEPSRAIPPLPWEAKAIENQENASLGLNLSEPVSDAPDGPVLSV